MADDALTPYLESLLTLGPEEVGQLSEQGRKDRVYAITLSFEATEPSFSRPQTRTSKFLPRAVASLAVKHERVEDAHRYHSISRQAKQKKKKAGEVEAGAQVAEEIEMQSAEEVEWQAPASSLNDDASRTFNAAPSEQERSSQHCNPSASSSDACPPKESRTDYYERLLSLNPASVQNLTLSHQNARQFAIMNGWDPASRIHAAEHPLEDLPPERPEHVSWKTWKVAHARVAMARYLAKQRATGAPISILRQKPSFGRLSSDASRTKASKPAVERPAGLRKGARVAGVASISKAGQGSVETQEDMGQKQSKRLASPDRVDGDGQDRGKAIVTRGPPTNIHPPSIPTSAKSQPKACKPEIIDLVDDDSSDCMIVDVDDSSEFVNPVGRVVGVGGGSSNRRSATATEPVLKPDRPCVTCRDIGRTCNFARQTKRCRRCKVNNRKCVFD